MKTDLGPWITTIRGKPFYLRNPHMSEIGPFDIAYALSNLCRFTGHVTDFYSVAQHCVLVSRNVPSDLAMQGLLHDAAEAYTGDINHPLKSMLDGPFKAIEAEIERAIAIRFGVVWPWSDEIHEADKRAYWTEIRDIAPRPPELSYDHDDSRTGVPWPEKIVGWSPEFAQDMWLDRFTELGGGW